MKRLYTLLLIALFLCSANLTNAGVAPKMDGMEKNAHEWCQAVKAGWNLGNSFESCDGNWNNTTWTYSGTSSPNTWETKWGNPATTKAMIHSIKEAGFNAIRIPVLWYPHTTNKTTMTIDATWLARVKEVVDWCLEEDMYVILNTHHEKWLESNPTNTQKAKVNAALEKLWTNIANAFIEYDGRLAFAGTNETTINWAAPTTENQEVQNSYNQTFINAVRATGGRNYYRNLIIQTYACSPYYGKTGLKVPTDVVEGRMSVEFHYYDPYNYCSGNTGSGYYYYWGKAYKDKGYTTPSDNEQTINNLFMQLKSLWYDKGLGVVVGEYGVSDHYTTAEKDIQHENMQYYLKTLVSYIRQYGFAGFAWDNNTFGNGTEKFGIFDRRNNMNVRTPYLYKGIMEGAGIDYDPNVGGNTGGNTGDYTGATTIWSGEEDLAWGEGFQYNIDAYYFEDFTPKDKIVFYCKKKAMAENYDMIQFFFGDWSTTISKFFVNGLEASKEFMPTSYSIDPDDMIIEITFDEATLSALKQKGLVLQGYGLTLTKILFVKDSSTGLSPLTVTKTSNESIYNIQGQRVTNTTRPGIYVVNGKKIRIR